MEKPYGCEICKKSFALAVLLKQHMRTHSEQFKFYCQFCPAGFTTKEHLLHHESSHSNERLFECKKCGKKFKQVAHLNVHNKIHTGERKYECPLCNKRFISNAKLKLHQRVHTGEAPYQCGFCDKTFTTGYNLRAHQARVHEKVKTHQCSDCDKLFFSMMELRNHRSLHTGERPYKCNECGKAFKKSSALGIHKRVHSSYKGFDCDICGKHFKVKNALKIHANMHRDNTYECDVCGRVFNRAMHLKKHKSRMHTDSLSSHQCNICKKSFQLKSSLKRHESSHFTNMGDYSCEECERQFKTQRSLDNHKRMHEGAKHKCHKCNKEFHLKTSLDTHLVRHLTDKPFGCQFCSSSFKQSSDLKNHLRMHQYRRQTFSCSVCPLTFKLPTHLASHVRNLHPNLDICHTEISADLLAEEICHEIDSDEREICMFDNDDKIYGIDSYSDMSFDSIMNLSSENSNSSMESSEIRNRQMNSRTDKNASVTFLFCGKLEGQQKCNHEENGGNGLKNGGNRGSNASNEQFEIWDNGAGRNNLKTFKSNRSLSSSINMTSNGNIPAFSEVSGYLNLAENIDFQRNMNGATDLNDPSRHHMIDLPKLSNYADTDNLLSWPSPQHINLLEHFDSSYEMDLSESFDDRHLNEDKDLRGKKFIRNRRKCFGYTSLNTSNAVGIGIFNGQVNNDQGQMERKETIPDIVINDHDLDVDLNVDTNTDLEDLNYSSDVIEEILGNNTLKDGMTTNSNTKLGLVPVHNGRGVDEHTNQNNQTYAINFCEPISDVISSNSDDMTKKLKDESTKTSSSSLNVVTMTNNSYGRPLVQDKPINNSVVDVEHHRNIMQEQHTRDTTGAMGEQNKDRSHFWPKHSLNTGNFPKNNMKREIINQNMAGNAGQNLFQSLTIQPKKECVFVTADTRNQSDKVKDHDEKLKCSDDSDSEVKFKKRKRKGKYIKAEKNVSFFVAKPRSGYSSSLEELSSEDSDIGDDTTITDSNCNSDDETVTTSQDSDEETIATTHSQDSDVETIATTHNQDSDVETIATGLDSDDETMATSQDSDDDSMLDSYSADESTFGNSSVETCSSVSRIDTDVDTDYDYYDSRLEDENSMTDNCSSIEIDDMIEFKIPYQKSHTQECLKKKDLWLKRNFKFRRNNIGSRNRLSYMVYKKNYSDLNKLTIRRNVLKIDRKYGKNRYITEEKIAGIRDVIKKKHSKIADYASDASTVRLEKNAKWRILKSDGINYSSDASTVKLDENEKLRILKSDGINYSSDASTVKLDENEKLKILKSDGINYSSDASTVKLDENEKLRILKSDGINYSSDASTVKLDENEKLRILKSDGRKYSSDALTVKLDANFRSDATCVSPGHNSSSPVFRIASPRYKTRYYKSRKMGKTAKQNSGDKNIPNGTTLVKSHLNVQYNRIASPRYKTRYAKLRLMLTSDDGKNSKKNEKENDAHEFNLAQLNSANGMEDPQLNTRKSSFSEVKIASNRTSIKSNKPCTNIPTQLKPITRSTLANIMNMSSSVVQPDMVNNISRKRKQKNELESPSATPTELSVRPVVLRSKVDSKTESQKQKSRQGREKPEITKKMTNMTPNKMENMTSSKMANMTPRKMVENMTAKKMANMTPMKMANMMPMKMAENMTPSNNVLPTKNKSDSSMEIFEITSEHKSERPTRSLKKKSPEAELKHVESKIVEENPRVRPNSNKTSNEQTTTDMKTPKEVKGNSNQYETNVISERSVRLRKENNKIKASDTPSCNMVTPKEVTDLLEDGTGNSKQCTTNVSSERSVRLRKVNNKIKASNTPGCNNATPIEVTDLPKEVTDNSEQYKTNVISERSVRLRKVDNKIKASNTPGCDNATTKQVTDLSARIDPSITGKDISNTESEERHLERKRVCKTVDLNKENKQQNGTVCITKRRTLKQNDLPCRKNRIGDLHRDDCEIKYFQKPEINIVENTGLEINNETKQKTLSDDETTKPRIVKRTTSNKPKTKKRRKTQKNIYGKRTRRKTDNRNKVDLISQSDNNAVKDHGKIFNHTSDDEVRDQDKIFNHTSDDEVRDQGKIFNHTSDDEVRDQGKIYNHTSDDEVRNQGKIFNHTSDDEVGDQGKIVNHTSECMEAISTAIDGQRVKINGERGEHDKSVEMNCAMFHTQDFTKNISKADDEARGSIPNTSLKFVENSFDEKESCTQEMMSKEILKLDFNEILKRKSNNVDEKKKLKNGHLETERNVFDQMEKESALYHNVRTSNIQNKLPYDMDGYIKSISDFIIPSFENTRLKCKERGSLFKQLNEDLSQEPETVENGLHAVQTRNDAQSSDNKVKCRERSRKTKSCVKQNIPKRSVSAEGKLSDLSQGSKHLKLPRNPKNRAKRSSSDDSVINSDACKRHKKSNILCFKRSNPSSSDCEDNGILWEVSKYKKIPKHQKNGRKRSSSFDSVVSNGTTGHHRTSKNKEKVTKRSKSSDRDFFNESEYHDENVNTDNSSDFCGCGTMCGYKRPLISVSNSEMANLSSATNRHDISKLSSCKTNKIIPPKQTESCSPIKRTYKELNLSSHERSTGNKEVWEKSSNTEKDGRFGHSFIPESGQHFTIKNHTRKKVCEVIQPIVTNILPNNEGSTHQHSENISIQSKTYEIWRCVISNQPIIRLERIDAN